MIVKLSRTKFLDQVTRYGFFAEQFPDCFSSEVFANNLPALLPLVDISRKSSEKYTTAPATLSTYKNDVSRRVLSVANPEAFLRLAKYISEHWKEILKATESNNSLSPIVRMHSYASPQVIINCESVKEKLKAKSDYVSGVLNCMLISLGYKYRLKVDISNCYNSIYTHSITWAICGKELAKEYFRTQKPEHLKKMYQMGDYLDTYVRYQKNNETNGIIVGPYTSRIISEIVLARIDQMLLKHGLKFRRYVDDYSLYFRTEAQAHDSLPIIEKVLNEFNLSLNTAKTKIDKFPCDVLSPIKKDLDKALKSEGVLGALNTAAQFHLKGEKGAYKYTLKYLQNHPIPRSELPFVLSTLINIMLLDPRHSKYVTKILKANIVSIDLEVLYRVLNRELACSLDNDLQQETLMFVQLIHDLNLPIVADNIIKIINSSNDFAIIIALDIWKNRRSSVIRNKRQAQMINEGVQKLMQQLNGEKLTGSRWLLLYELHTRKLVPEKMLPRWDPSPFFEKMAELKISFYRG